MAVGDCITRSRPCSSRAVFADVGADPCWGPSIWIWGKTWGDDRSLRVEGIEARSVHVEWRMRQRPDEVAYRSLRRQADDLNFQVLVAGPSEVGVKWGAQWPGAETPLLPPSPPLLQLP